MCLKPGRHQILQPWYILKHVPQYSDYDFLQFSVRLSINNKVNLTCD